MYGRTDLGRKGMREFFRTHECNDVCRLLGLGTRRPAPKAVPNTFSGNSMPEGFAGQVTRKAAKKPVKAAKAAAKPASSAAANPSGSPRQGGKGKRRKVALG